MDWEPLPSASSSRTTAAYDFGPQRFFPPVKPSGLEDVFERGLRMQDRGEERRGEEGGKASWWTRWVT